MSALLSSLHAFRHMTSGLESWRVEVEALAQLRHPNIIAILGAVIEPPTYACVLEYCDGHDLSTALQGDTPPGFVLRVAKGVASGVEYVHSQQLIHRDIKGSNILLEASGKRRGRVWGGARGRVEGREGERGSRTLLGDGAILGKYQGGVGRWRWWWRVG